jgi:outer membrane protein
MKEKIILLLVLLLFGAPAFCATIIKIGVVDITRVFDEYPETKKATQALNKEYEEQKVKIGEFQDEILKLEDELKTNIMLSEEEKERRKAVIERKKKELQELRTQAEQKLLEKERKLTRKIIEKIYTAIKHLAEEKGISLVVDKAGVLFSSPELDLTEEVINRLSKERK